MTSAQLKRLRELFYYGIIGLTLILALVVISVTVIPGVTREKYVTAALALSLLVTLVCIVFWVGHHLEIKLLGSRLSKLIWTGLIAGLIAPIPAVIIKPKGGSIEVDKAVVFDPSTVEYLPENLGRPSFQRVTSLLSSRLSFRMDQEVAIPILFTVKNFTHDMDGKPNISLSVLVKNKTTHYASAEDFPEPLTDFRIAGDAFMSAETMDSIRAKYDLSKKSAGIFFILDQLLPQVAANGELLIRVTATDNLTKQSASFDKVFSIHREQ